jgi:hypothetical protein
MALKTPGPASRGSGTIRASQAWTVRGSINIVWKERHSKRMRRLENEVAEAKAGQAELQRRVELFEKIAATAGVEVDGPVTNTAGSEPVPPSLLAAAQDPRQHGAPVRLDVDGRELIAVVDGEGGDPHEWLSAIRRLAPRMRSAS